MKMFLLESKVMSIWFNIHLNIFCFLAISIYGSKKPKKEIFNIKIQEKKVYFLFLFSTY